MIKKMVVAILLMCASMTVCFSLRGYYKPISYLWVMNEQNDFLMISCFGAVGFVHIYCDKTIPINSHHYLVYHYYEGSMAKDSRRRLNFFNFGSKFWSFPGPYHAKTYTIPFWVPLGLFMFYPTITFIRSRRLKRWKIKGHCLKCGYNLTGNVSGKCSECGTPIS